MSNVDSVVIPFDIDIGDQRARIFDPHSSPYSEGRTRDIGDFNIRYHSTRISPVIDTPTDESIDGQSIDYRR